MRLEVSKEFCMGGEVPEGSSLTRYLLTFIMDFAHGALVTSGVLVIGFCAYQLVHYGVEGLNPKTLWGYGSSHERTVTDAVLPMLYAKDKAPLDARMGRVVARISARYRTSPLVAEDLARIAQKEGQRQDVDPLLILSVISVASGFNPFAESAVGAQGLMQVVPRFDSVLTASGNAEMSFFDPLQNIHTGTQTLKTYLQQGKGVEIAVRQYGISSGITDIGFARRVMQNYARFSQIAGPGAGKEGTAEKEPSAYGH